MPVELSSSNFTEEVEKSELPVVIDFYANWCGPCKLLKPVFEQLAGEYEGVCKFATVNVEEDRELSIRFGVTSLPTLIFVKDGEIVGRSVGAKTKDELKKEIDAIFDF